MEDSPDIQEVFEMLAEKLGGKPELGSPKAQIQTLLEAYALLKTPSKLKAGDIIRGKQLLTQNQQVHWDQPHVIVEILEKPLVLTVDPERVGYSSAAVSYNAIVAQVVKGTVCRYFIDTSLYELYPGIDKIMKESLSS